MKTLFVLLLLFAIVMIWSAIEQKFLTVKSYAVHSDKISKDLDGTSFVVLADLHNMTFGKGNDRLAERIDKLSPDFIVVAGDLVDKNLLCYPGNAYKLLENLAGKYKIYYAYGNHEQRLIQYASGEWPEDKKKLHASWLEYKVRLKKLNVEFLDNSSAFYYKNNNKICIHGLSIADEFFKKGKAVVMKKEYLATLLGNTNDICYNLLIAHNPFYFHDYVSWGADLTVSGHIHGGMVRLPGIGGIVSPQVRFFPKYDSGLFTEDDKSMIVSRGLGTHSYMPRLFNLPEIVHIKLMAKTDSMDN